ncbi:MAG: SDR family oxidoreductase [Thermoplasmatales archaeon]
MRILVIGGNGFVGSYLMKYFSCDGTSKNGGNGLYPLDVINKEQIREILSKLSPEIVINASGLTNVDYCETHLEEAFLINGTCVKDIADMTESLGSVFFHFSSDYVFDGNDGNYIETAPTNPLNTYGRSKLLAESLLKDSKCVILRISTPYGRNFSGNKKTFFDFITSNLSSGIPIRIVDDQYSTPTYIGEIPKAITSLYENNQSGIFNLGSINCMSRFDFSVEVANVFSLPSGLIKRVSSSEVGFKARRPSNTCMNSSKISKFITIKKVHDNLIDMITS